MNENILLNGIQNLRDNQIALQNKIDDLIAQKAFEKAIIEKMERDEQ